MHNAIPTVETVIDIDRMIATDAVVAETFDVFNIVVLDICVRHGGVRPV
jgi:hypothetical protein